MQAEMESTQLAADDARFDCARRFTEVEYRKRHEFLNCTLSTMDAHLRHYKQGFEV